MNGVTMTVSKTVNCKMGDSLFPPNKLDDYSLMIANKAVI